MTQQDFDNILGDFAVFDDWEERYMYIIALGQQLPRLSVEDKTPATKVDGCVSQVWLKCEARRESGGLRLYFIGESDAFIVGGLIAILLRLYGGMSPRDILGVDAESMFRQLGLEQRLSPSRRNGFFAMVGRIRGFAEYYCEN